MSPCAADHIELERIVRLTDGVQVTVRSARPGDEAGMVRLYAALTDEDRQHRFFSSYLPSEAELAGWVRTEALHRGHRLVATLDDGQIVGDAGYFLLDDGSGDGELDVTVAEAHRGGLGHALLDALVDVAASHGVPNLRAGVRFDNRPMLALLRRRGDVFLPDGDHGTVHAVIGVVAAMPSWPADHRRRRVLVEGRSGDWRSAAAVLATGTEVRVCTGPRDDRPWQCPVLDGGPCALVEQADAVVFGLPLDVPACAQVLRGHDALHADTPLFVEARSYAGHPTAVDIPTRAIALSPEPSETVQHIRSVLDEGAHQPDKQGERS